MTNLTAGDSCLGVVDDEAGDVELLKSKRLYAPCKLNLLEKLIEDHEDSDLPRRRHSLGVGIDLDLGKHTRIHNGDLGHVVVSPLALLLLKLDRDSADGSLLDTLHHHPPGNLVAESLGGDESDLVADALVGVEVVGHLGVVLLDDDLGGLLHGLGTDASHEGSNRISAAHQVGAGYRKKYQIRIAAMKATNVLIPGNYEAGQDNPAVRVQVTMPNLVKLKDTSSPSGTHLGYADAVKCENGGDTDINYRFLADFEYDFNSKTYAGSIVRPTIMVRLFTAPLHTNIPLAGALFSGELIGECKIDLLDVHRLYRSRFTGISPDDFQGTCLFMIILKTIMSWFDGARKWIPCIRRRVTALELVEPDNIKRRGTEKTLFELKTSKGQQSRLLYGKWPLTKNFVDPKHRPKGLADPRSANEYYGEENKKWVHGFILLDIRLVDFEHAYTKKDRVGQGRDGGEYNRNPYLGKPTTVGFFGSAFNTLKDLGGSFLRTVACGAFTSFIGPLFLCIVAILLLVIFVSQLLNVTTKSLVHSVLPI